MGTDDVGLAYQMQAPWDHKGNWWFKQAKEVEIPLGSRELQKQ